MTTYLTILVAILIVVLLIGLALVIFGTVIIDRLMATQLFGTVGVAILLILSVIQKQEALINVALILALLAPVTMIVFIRLMERKK